MEEHSMSKASQFTSWSIAPKQSWEFGPLTQPTQPTQPAGFLEKSFVSDYEAFFFMEPWGAKTYLKAHKSYPASSGPTTADNSVGSY